MAPHHPHPWRDLRQLAHVVLHWRDDLPPGRAGGTDGRNVWLALGQSQVQRRCAIAHELVHLRRGHVSCQDPAVETSVRRETARRLIPDVHRIADAMAWSRGDVAEAADELWVTAAVLGDRLGGLHPAERAFLAARMEDVQQWA